MTQWTGRLAVAAATCATAMMVVTACGKTGGSSPAVAPSAGSATVAVSPSTTGGSGSESLEDAPVVLADGRHPVFVKVVDVAARTVTFDLIVFLTGDAAYTQWVKDHHGETPEALNGYYIINNNTKLRTLPVTSTVVVKTVEGDPSNPKTLPFADLATYQYLADSPFWITVVKGQVTLIEQQFIP